MKILSLLGRFWMLSCLLVLSAYGYAMSSLYDYDGEVTIKNNQVCLFIRDNTVHFDDITIQQEGANSIEKPFMLLQENTLNSKENCAVVPYEFQRDVPYLILMNSRHVVEFCLHQSDSSSTIALFANDGRCSQTPFDMDTQNRQQKRFYYLHVLLMLVLWVVVLCLREKKNGKKGLNDFLNKLA